MLSAQLVGRLLPEIESSDNIRNLLRYQPFYLYTVILTSLPSAL